MKLKLKLCICRDRMLVHPCLYALHFLCSLEHCMDRFGWWTSLMSELYLLPDGKEKQIIEIEFCSRTLHIRFACHIYGENVANVANWVPRNGKYNGIARKSQLAKWLNNQNVGNYNQIIKRFTASKRNVWETHTDRKREGSMKQENTKRNSLLNWRKKEKQHM